MTQAKLKNEQGLKKEFEVVIPAAAISARTEKELENYSKKVKIPGFRAGKVPVSVVKQRYGQSVNIEVLDKLIKEEAEKLFKEKKLQPALEPEIKPEEYVDGKDFKFTLEFETFPEVPEYDFSKIKIERPVAEVTKKEISESLDRIAKSNVSYEAVTGRTKAEKGDMVTIDFTGSKDGVEFPGGKSEGFKLELGSGQFIPGFEDQVVGLEVGKEKTFPITFPKDYHSKDLAGAKTEFKIKLHEILQPKKGELDDEFAKKLGFESIAKVEEAIEKQMKADSDSVSFTKAKKALFDEIDNKVKFEVPEGMIKLDYNSVLHQMKHEAPNGDAKELEAEARKLAERRVRLGILLSELGKKNNVQVSLDEVRQAIWQKAQSFPGQEQRVIEFYQKNQQAIEQVRGEILEDKVVKFLLEKVNVTDKKVSREELYKEDEEETGGHVHGPDCNHGHDHDDHVHGPDCNHDHDHEPKKKSTTKKKK